MIGTRLGLLCLFTPVALFSAINVQVIGSTNVSALLRYDAPVDGACMVEVSENADLKPLVHDVDPALFPGANLDSRAGGVFNGRSRLFLAGRRAVDQAADGKWYSRALQTFTTHYYRVTCGTEVAAGSFRTANIPVGVPFPWPIPQDPATGNFRWPSTDNNDRTQTIIDPNYGTLIRRVSVPGDMPSELNPDLEALHFKSAAGANWQNPAGALNATGATHALPAQDWLVLMDPGLGMLTEFYVQTESIDYITVQLTGSSQGATPDERTVDVCLTLDGSTCAGEIRTAVFGPQDQTVTLGSARPVDTWGSTLWLESIFRNSRFGVMMRKHIASAAPVTIRSAAMSMSLSDRLMMPNGGFEQTCAPVKSNGGYHCSFPNDGGSNQMFWIQPETGEVRWLGKLTATGWGGNNAQCRSHFAAFDTYDPNTYYCVADSNGKTVLLKGTYKGNDQAAAPGSKVNMQWVNLTPEPNTIADLIRGFNPDFNPSQWACTLASVTDHYVVFPCRMDGQDSIGWIAVYDLANREPAGTPGAGKIVAAAKSFAAANSRWCGLHTMQFAGHGNWVGWSAQWLWGGGPGLGPYTVTLLSPLPASGGRMTVSVSGEPLIGNNPGTYLMDAAEGDVFGFTNSDQYDFLRITRKLSPTQWEVERVVPHGSPVARAAGATLMAVCSAQNLSAPKMAPDVYWNFVEDPNAQDTTNTKWVAERILTGGHIVERGPYRVMEHWEGYKVATSGIPQSLNQQPAYTIPVNPKWAGVRSWTGLDDNGLGAIYQQHPSYENHRAADGRNNWFVDLIPFAGTPALTSGIQRIPGYAQVYKALGTRLNRVQFPTFARCGGRQLKELTRPITDADAYSFCIGSVCMAGAGPDDVYVNCPAPVSADPAGDGNSISRCTENPAGDDRSVCVSDMTPFGQTVSQFFFHPSGTKSRALTNGLFAWNAPRTYLSLDTASSLPDGSWVVFPSFANNARKDLYMVKVPPAPSMDEDASKTAQFSVLKYDITPPLGARDIVLRWGSDGTVPRATDPLCPGYALCTITATARPLDFFFSMPVFRDANGQVIGSGGTTAFLTSGVLGSGPEKPVVASAASIVNYASLEAKLAPGALVAIFGDKLAECAAQANAYPLPVTLCEATVSFNGIPAHLYSADRGRLDVFLPGSLQPGQDVTVVIERSGIKSDPVLIPGANILEAAPAIHSYYLDGQQRFAQVRNSDNSLNGPARTELNIRPLRLGEAASVYANGLGAVTPPVGDGEAVPQLPPVRTSLPVDVLVNGVKQPVSFSGLTPGSSGMYRVDFKVDPATPIRGSGQDEIWLKVKDLESPHLPVVLAGPDQPVPAK